MSKFLTKQEFYDWVLKNLGILSGGGGGGGGGDVTGPGASTDHAIARFHLATGKVIQNSTPTIDDAGTITIPAGEKYKIGTRAIDFRDVDASERNHRHPETPLSPINFSGSSGDYVGGDRACHALPASSSDNSFSTLSIMGG